MFSRESACVSLVVKDLITWHVSSYTLNKPLFLFQQLFVADELGVKVGYFKPCAVHSGFGKQYSGARRGGGSSGRRILLLGRGGRSS